MRPPPRGAAHLTIAQRFDMDTTHSYHSRTTRLDLREEDTKGARRMPWRGKSTKDAASCDKPRGAANTLRSGGLRMGEPSGGHAPLLRPEPIGPPEATGGTETSKYPEEEKSTEIPGVAASETGPAQTWTSVKALGRCRRRGCGTARTGCPSAPTESETAHVAERPGKAGGTG